MMKMRLRSWKRAKMRIEMEKKAISGERLQWRMDFVSSMAWVKPCLRNPS